MISSCSVIIRKTLGQEPAALGARAAWAMMSNADIDVTVVLVGDGIYSVLGKSGYLKELYLKLLGEECKVHAIQEDLEARGIDPDSLPKGIAVTPAAEISEVVMESDSIMTF